MNPWLLAAWFACQSFDAVTTTIALNRPGYAESNPLMRHGHRTAFKVSVNVGGLLWYRQTKRRIIPVLFASTGCAAGVINLRRLQQ